MPINSQMERMQLNEYSQQLVAQRQTAYLPALPHCSLLIGAWSRISHVIMEGPSAG
jgi:hypothetical protein